MVRALDDYQTVRVRDNQNIDLSVVAGPAQFANGHGVSGAETVLQTEQTYVVWPGK